MVAAWSGRRDGWEVTRSDEHGVIAAEKYEPEQFGCYSREVVKISDTGCSIVQSDDCMRAREALYAPLWLVRELLEAAERREHAAKLRAVCKRLRPRLAGERLG